METEVLVNRCVIFGICIVVALFVLILYWVASTSTEYPDDHSDTKETDIMNNENKAIL